ncbi:hypothetical protein [Actinoplanes sp. NPDC089786]|uniref:hypothetical protein n=1 Tax=Actinoplanes sp. NPDC089786 TaxID=3155185 RepID=UPI003447C7EC
MDADEFRPVRRPAAGAAKRAPVRRPRKLARPDLGAGAQQKVRDLLYDLHERAGRPALEDLEKRIAADDRLDASPKKDVLHRIISRGGPAALDDVRAVARTLARAFGLDEYTIAAQVTELMRLPERPSAPGSLLVPCSAYLAQVRQIAPPELVGREAELQELSRFCLDEQAGAYTWWQAGPWAGKSALLSTFVLNPAEQVQARVQVVAFFITARLAAQDTRQAFTAVVGEQLAALTGQQVPAVIDESLREAWLLDLLDQAAQSCQQRGMRLVLLVDGLDEDRGATTGPYARSIAGLLPGVVPPGMRVIVAGRPNPPVPDDVPDWHPLRDPGIIRPLTDSPHARDLQRLGRSELNRLLKGSPVEQDLLGLLTAARGGLSGEDLNELTGAGLIEIEEVLHTVAGRTFTRRTQRWAAVDGPLVYLLGHEELAAAARRYLGETRLAGYRDRLHDWADRYRRPSHAGSQWPPGTPEYLLLGYPRMLGAAGYVTRLIDLVTDPDRHDRMLDLSGGDAAALGEITACQDLVLAEPRLDLEAVLRLCIRRTNLADRNSHIPTDLPAVWVALGQPARAEALAGSIADPYKQAQALTEVARGLAATDPDRAETVARSISGPCEQARALAAVAERVAIGGDLERVRQLTEQAETVARSITYPFERAQALVPVAEMIAIAGDSERAETVARSIVDPYEQAQALIAVAKSVAIGGDLERVRQLTEQAETAARSIIYPEEQALALTAVAEVLAAASDLDGAEAVVCSISDSHEQARAVLTEVITAIGGPDKFWKLVEQARQLADQPPDAEPHPTTYTPLQARTLTSMAELMVIVDPGRARRLADRAEAVARSIADPYEHVQALVAVANRIAIAGDSERARQLIEQAAAVARSVAEAYEQGPALVEVAKSIAIAGDSERARQFIEEAEAVARAITYPPGQAAAMAAVAESLAVVGDLERAEGVAFAITDAREQAPALVAVAERFVIAGDPERALQLTDLAEAVARSITCPDEQAPALVPVCMMLAADDPDRAERLARSITHPYWLAWALVKVAGAMATTDLSRARQLTEQAEAVARRITGPVERARALALVAETIVATDPDPDPDRAAAAARSITDPYQQARALVARAGVTAAVGDLEQAGRLLGKGLAVASWQIGLLVLSEYWPQVMLRCVDELAGNNRSDTPKELITERTGASGAGPITRRSK